MANASRTLLVWTPNSIRCVGVVSVSALCVELCALNCEYVTSLARYLLLLLPGKACTKLTTEQYPGNRSLPRANSSPLKFKQIQTISLSDSPNGQVSERNLP